MDGNRRMERELAPTPPPRFARPELTILATSAVLPGAPGDALIVVGREREFVPFDWSATMVGFVLRGSTTVEFQARGKPSEARLTPEGFTVIPGGGRFSVRSLEVVEALCLPIEPRQVEEIAQREIDFETSVELIAVWQQSDRELIDLAHQFAAFLRSPHRRSELYAETLWTQIVLKLIWDYSSLPRRVAARYERLGDARVRRVIDFMQSTLSEDVSLSDLAAVASLSPNYFLNAFRKATGKTPHSYRTDLRIARACELLRNPHKPIVQVAVEVGYSSQSHLTTVFRRLKGVTPAVYRNQLLTDPIQPD